MLSLFPPRASEVDDDDDFVDATMEEDLDLLSMEEAFSWPLSEATSMTGLNQFISIRSRHRRHTGISRKSFSAPKIRAGIMARSSRWQFLQKLNPSKKQKRG